MTNKEKALMIANNNCTHANCSHGEHYFTSERDCYKAAMEMADWKDEQPISELNGWHTEEPVEDGWYLVDTPDFPKDCHCVVAEWDNCAKSFYSEASDYPIEFCKWKLIERR